MGWRGWSWKAAQVTAVALALLIVGGHLLGQPLVLSYVESGSMEPALAPGDGFVAIPTSLTGAPEEGDVIVFRAEQLDGGGLTTHRVVDVTDEGYVTKGDDNPFTDQEGGEPPVRRSQIVAVAWQPEGAVLVVPGIGRAVETTRSVLGGIQRHLAGLLGIRSLLGVQGVAYLWFVASVVAYAISVRRDTPGDRRRDRERDRATGIDPRLFAVAIAAAFVLAASAAMIVPAGTHAFGIISAEMDSSEQHVIEQGSNQSIAFPVRNGGVLPVTVLLEPASDGVAVDRRMIEIDPRTTVNTTATLSAPPETGHYQRHVIERRYLSVIPTSSIRTLYAVDPWMPIVVINGLVGASAYLASISLFGRTRIRTQSRDGPSRRAWLRSRIVPLVRAGNTAYNETGERSDRR